MQRATITDKIYGECHEELASHSLLSTTEIKLSPSQALLCFFEPILKASSGVPGAPDVSPSSDSLVQCVLWGSESGALVFSMR